MVDLEAGVIGQGRESGEAGDAGGLEPGVVLKRLAGLLDFGEVQEVIGSEDGDGEVFEQVPDFPDLVAVVGGQYELHGGNVRDRAGMGQGEGWAGRRSGELKDGRSPKLLLPYSALDNVVAPARERVGQD